MILTPRLSVSVALVGAQGVLTFDQTATPLAIDLSRFFVGPKGDAGDPSTVWGYFVQHWSVSPAQVGTTEAGAVFGYTLGAVTRYRLVPQPYAAEQDAFYSTFTGGTLSGLIASRGE